MASLLIQPPEGEGEKVELGEGRILIGRGHDADLQVDDPTVSRAHASLVKGPHGYVLSAEGERPIRTGGSEQTQLLLTHGLRFELGRTTFTFLDPRSAATEELPAASSSASNAPEDDEPIALPPSGAARFFRGALFVVLLLAVAAILVHVFVLPAREWRQALGGSGTSGGADAGVALPPLDPSIELADPDAPLYALDTDTPRMELPLADTPGTLAGELAAAGRRRILYAPPGGADEEVFGAEFNLPAVGLTVAGRLFVCANRLVGRPSELTEGATPDPRDGLDLWCRARTGGDWSEPARLSLAAAPWLVELQPASGAVIVRYVHDAEGSLVGRPRAGDGLFAVRYDGEGFGTPTLVTDYEPLAEPLPDQR